MTRRCPGCGSEAAVDAKFCAHCGGALAARCAACGAEHVPGARFCAQCGAAIAAATSPAVTRATPVLSADPLASATVTSPIERRHMTFMFCDLVGSTQLSREIDPEDLRDIVSDYRETAAAAVRRYEGTIAQYYGDGILIYFGYPIAHEDDGRRAVQAALEIVEAVAKLNARLGPERPVSLAVRIGVHTGIAVVGDVGGANRTERLAMGDTPNIASRIQGLAKANTVVISPATLRLVSEFFQTERLGPQMIKGVAEPVEAFVVLGASGAHGRLDGATAPQLTSYIGRETIMAPLGAAWRDASAGAGRVVVLTGEPGVGKSRLVHVFRDQLSTGMHHRLDCFCSPYHASSALHPITEMLRGRLRLAEETDPRLKLDRVRATLLEHRCDADGALPLIAQLLGVPPEAGYSPVALHPLTQKQRTLEILLAMILVPTERRPTLLVIEDAHWIDPTTLELVGAVMERMGDRRLLVLMTARPAFRAPWEPRASLVQLTVSDLSAADTEAMIRGLTGGKRLPRQVLTLLVQKSEGNPLFVEEMTRMLLESGWLVERDGGYELTGPVPDAAVPTRLQDLLRERLDRMEPEARMVMQIASVVGRDFMYELLTDVLPAESRTIRRGLQQLLDAGLVFATGGGFTIKHDLIKDVAYESLLKRSRQQYHERVALALEGPFATIAQGQPERLAQHWSRAGQPLRAVPYWLQAGQKAVASSAVEEAATHLRHGLELVAAQPVSVERDRLELDLLSTLGTALTIQKGWAAPEVAEAYSRAHALSERVGDSPTLFWVLWGLWAFYLVKGDQTQGLQFAERMMSFAESLGDESLVLESDFALGLSHYYMGRLATARQHLDRAVATYVPERHHANCFLSCQDVGVTSRSVAAMVRYLQGDTALAIECSAGAVRLADELKHPFSQAYALGCAAWLQSYRREPAAMAARAGETMALSQAQALGWWLLWGMIFAGRGTADAGEVDAGIAQMENALGMYRGVGTGMVVPYFLTQLAGAHAMRGDFSRAIERLDDARGLVAQGGEAIAAAEIDRLEAEVRARRAQANGGSITNTEADAIESLLRRAIDTSRRQGARLFELRSASSLAMFLRARGRGATARPMLDEAIRSVPDQTPTRDLDEARNVRGALTGA
ncbi:MAG: AAA family ATPase [Acidobacteria bacterium]|nr:AAA family ATPase [Acidobacteriota bacterium]